MSYKLTLRLLGNIFRAKGQIPVGTGIGSAELLSVGSDTQVLTADSTQPGGVKWAAASGGGGGSGIGNTFHFGTPLGTSSASMVMMGLGSGVGGAAATPASSGRLLIIGHCLISNTNNSLGGNMNLYYGTGSAPANGAALTGSQVVNANAYSPNITSSQRIGVSLSGVVTGLTVGTTYWIDMALQQIGGGTATVNDPVISVIEF